MWRQTLVSCLVLTAAASVQGESAEAKATQEVLDILTNPQLYEKRIRPSENGATEVKVQTYIREIDVDDINMKADFDLTFRMIWTDSRLAYQSGGVEYINILDPSLAWLPDAFFKNAITTQRESVYPESYLRVFPDGKVIYSTRLSIIQNCPMDLSRYPHDVQVCKIQIGSYGYTADEVNLVVGENPVQVGSNLHAEKFNLENLDKDMFDYCNTRTATGEYSCIQVSFRMRRGFGTYLGEWYIPIMFLVIVAYFSFLIPKQEFLGRLVLTIVPLISVCFMSSEFRKSTASVPYTKAVDVFSGISVTVIFAMLVYVIVCARALQKAEGGGDSEEGGKAAEGWRGALKKVSDKGELITRSVLIGGYGFFIFVYFVAYCGTG